VAVGDSTLDFEIRAFVDSLDKRLRVQHQINNDVARLLEKTAAKGSSHAIPESSP
jgi:small-conductance mechanosensitive channel